jgi:hypothetical protein
MADSGNKPIKVCVVTSSRSEYGLMRWLLDREKLLKLKLLMSYPLKNLPTAAL